MGRYTGELEDRLYRISPEDEGFREELMETAASFRSFGEALTEFLTERGYAGEPTDTKGKIAYIRRKFQEAAVGEIPRNLKECFEGRARLVKRSTALAFCEAFHLTREEREDFFRRIYLQQGLDCHKTEEEARRKIQSLWEKIAGRGGLAQREKKELLCDACTGRRRGCAGKGCKSSGCFVHDLYYCGCGSCQCRKCSCKAEPPASRSVWDIYQQIFGYEEGQLEKLSEKREGKRTPSRSLAPVIKGSALLHVLAQESFPDRQGLEAILRGESKSEELVRKTLLLLLFYEYWVEKALKRKELVYQAEIGEAAESIGQINDQLEASGYPSLYPGNPYDWLFLFASVDDEPLTALREFMRELYLAAEERH